MTNKKDKSMIEEDEQQKWFAKEDLQDLAKIGGDFLKKTLGAGMDVFKEAKENLPKEATNLFNKGKEELRKGLSQETAKNLVGFAVEKFFTLARNHRLEFSIRIRRNEEVLQKDKRILRTKK